MSDKHKTLAECKDEVARKHGHATFNRVRFAGTEAQLKIMDEAAELYAGQTKQSALVSTSEFVKCTCTNGLQYSNCTKNCGHGQEPEPVSIDIIDEAARFRDNFDYTSCLTSNGIKTGEAVMNSFIEGAKWQSQQQSANDELKQQLSDKDTAFILSKNAAIRRGEKIKELQKQKEELVECLNAFRKMDRLDQNQFHLNKIKAIQTILKFQNTPPKN